MNKLYTSTIISLFAFLVLSCVDKNQKKEKEILEATPKTIPVDSIHNWATKLSLLDSNTPEFGDIAKLLNHKIEHALQEARDSTNRSAIITSLSASDNGVSILESQDKKLTLFSWDTRMGGSMGEYMNLVGYQSDRKIVWETLEENTIYYDSLFELQDRYQKSIYLVSGHGKSSNLEHFMGLDALTIDNKLLVESKIFPDKKSSWRTYFSSEEMGSLPKPGFLVDNNGASIGYPVALEFGNVWKPYFFDGTHFTEEIYRPDKPIEEHDFTPKNELQFINGSEMPSSFNDHEILFEDGVVLHERDFQEEEKMEVSFLGPSDVKREIEFTNNLRLIGKMKNLIFFDGGGVPENWLLHIYDLQQERLLFSTYLSQTMLVDHHLVFSKLSDNQKLQTKNIGGCEEGYGRFEVFMFQILKDYPQIQPTELAYCAYIQ